MMKLKVMSEYVYLVDIKLLHNYWLTRLTNEGGVWDSTNVLDQTAASPLFSLLLLQTPHSLGKDTIIVVGHVLLLLPVG